MFKILEETNSISIAILDWIEIFIAWIFITVSHFAPLKIIMAFMTVKKFMKINLSKIYIQLYTFHNLQLVSSVGFLILCWIILAKSR